MVATDETVEEEEAEEDCSKTVAATGVVAATSGAEADAIAVTVADAGIGDDGDRDENDGVGAAGAESWDDSVPGLLGDRHISHVVKSSWFWNVQKLQVHFSPGFKSPPPLPLPPEGSFGPAAGADRDCPRYRPSVVYDEVAVTAAAPGGGYC